MIDASMTHSLPSSVVHPAIIKTYHLRSNINPYNLMKW